MVRHETKKSDKKLISRNPGKYEKLFSGDEEPPAPMSIRQVEAFEGSCG